MDKIARVAVFPEEHPAPEWAKYRAVDETDFLMYFEELKDAIHYAHLNECRVYDMTTDHLEVDTTKGDYDE